MKISFNIDAIALRMLSLSTINELLEIDCNLDDIDKSIKNPKPKFIPMMTARRLSDGCKLAVDAAMELTLENSIDAVIFSSASGELEHNYKVLKSTVQKTDVSPTDFSMSVHNAAVGNYTILSKRKIPSSSVSAGIDSFVMALTDAYAMIKTGAKNVLICDYDVTIPEFFKVYLDVAYPTYPHALALLISSGDQFTVKTEDKTQSTKISEFASVKFMQEYAKRTKEFLIPGRKLNYRFIKNS
ncbi:beta-ketoacyl synthase chain length factor [Succinivibrio sp.]|uniref:beta-ketoacyl synthase chain length factor n=1 Tax=Succinivibrio sp. TaxID=2053619 RepID=UPI003866ACB3